MNPRIHTTAAANAIIQTRQQLETLFLIPSRLLEEMLTEPARFYSSFSVPKANGDMRIIRPPLPILRTIHRLFLDNWKKRVRFPSWLHGGIRGRSIVTHASKHVGQELLLTLDIGGFFPSTRPAYLDGVLASLGFVGEAAEIIKQLVTLDGGLPQGSPTSSILANLAFACAGGDERFIRLCGSRNLGYSRYVDDIAVSGDDIFRDLRGPFVQAIKLSGYDTADDKTLVMPRSARQIITGLIVNDRMRPTREYVAELKNDIRLCQQFGAPLIADCHGLTLTALRRRLTGRVGYLRQLDPKLARRFRGMLCGVRWRP